MKINKMFAAIGGAGVLAASLFVAAPAMAATAAPAAAQACSKPNPVTPSRVSATAKVKYSASGSCSSGYELVVLLKHYYAPPIPDATADESDDYTQPFSAGRSVCDGGGSTTYYTRASFYVSGSADVIQNSPNITINNHC